jgi:hypothetical protein
LPVNTGERRVYSIPTGDGVASPRTCHWLSVRREDLTSITPPVRRHLLDVLETSVRAYVFEHVHSGKEQDQAICVDISHTRLEPDLLNALVGSLLDKQTGIESIVLFCDRAQAPTLLEFQDAAQRREDATSGNHIAGAGAAPTQGFLPNALVPAVIVDDAFRVIWLGASRQEQAVLDELRNSDGLESLRASETGLVRRPGIKLLPVVNYATLRITGTKRCHSLLLELLENPRDEDGVHQGYFLVPSGRYVRLFLHVPNMVADPQRRGWVAACLALHLAESIAEQGLDRAEVVLFSSTHSMQLLVREVARQLGLQSTPWHEGYFAAGTALPEESAHAKMVAWLTDVISSGSQTTNVLAALAQTASRAAWVGTVVDLRTEPAQWVCPGKAVRSVCLAPFPTDVHSDLPSEWPKEQLQYVHPVTLSLHSTPLGESLDYPMQATIQGLLAEQGVLVARPLRREGRLNLYYINVQELVRRDPKCFAEAIVTETENVMSERVPTPFFARPVHLIMTESGLRELLEPLVTAISDAQKRRGIEPAVTRSYIRPLPSGIRFAHPLHQDFVGPLDEEPIFWASPNLTDKNVLFVTDAFIQGTTLKYVFEEVRKHGGRALMAAAIISRLPYREELFLRHMRECRDGVRLGVTCLASMRIPPVGMVADCEFDRAIDRVKSELPPHLASLCASQLDELKIGVQEVNDITEATCYAETRLGAASTLLALAEERERRTKLAMHKCALREKLELLHTHVNLEDRMVEDAVRHPSPQDSVLLEILAEEPHLRNTIKRRYDESLRERALDVMRDSSAYRYQRACALLVLGSMSGSIPRHLRKILTASAGDGGVLVLAAALTAVEVVHQTNLAEDLQTPLVEFRRTVLKHGLSRSADTALLLLEGALGEARTSQVYEQSRTGERTTHAALQTLERFYFDAEETHMNNVWSVLGLARILAKPSVTPDDLAERVRAWDSVETKLCRELLPALFKISPAIRIARTEHVPGVSEAASALIDPADLIHLISEVGSSLRELDERIRCSEEAWPSRIREKAASGLSTLAAQILRLQRPSHVAKFLALSQGDVCHAIVAARDTVVECRRRPFDSLTIQLGKRVLDITNGGLARDVYGSVLVFMDSQTLRWLFENLMDNALAHAFSAGEPRNATIQLDCDKDTSGVVIAMSDYGTAPLGLAGAGITSCRRRVEHWGGRMSDVVQLAGPTRGHKLELTLVRGFCPPLL